MRPLFLFGTVLLAGCAAAPGRSAADGVPGTLARESLDNGECRLAPPGSTRCRREAECAHERSAGSPTCATALAIARACESRGQDERARRILREVDCRDALLERARLEIAVDPAEGERTLTALLRRDADDVDALSLLVTLHQARGEHEIAEGVCRRAEVLDAAGLWYACARAALEGERLHDAEASYRRAIASEPSVRVLVELGDLLARERRSEEAADVFRSALSIDDNDYEAILGFARALRLQGCLRAAALVFDRAIQLAPRRPEAYWYRATYGISPEGMVGDREHMQASRDLERFVELAGDDPRFREEVEEVTRHCPRDDTPSWRGYRVVRACRPGLLDRIRGRGGSRELAEMQRMIERQIEDGPASTAARCDLPWRPPSESTEVPCPE